MPTQKGWIKAPAKSAKPKISDELKWQVQKKADLLVESYLKPNFILPPPEDMQWNYIVDIYTKWHQRFFYFCAKYRCPRENCISEFFEMKFTRLEYVGDRKFNISYMRHTGQWWEILEGLSLDECIEEIRQQELLHP